MQRLKKLGWRLDEGTWFSPVIFVAPDLVAQAWTNPVFDEYEADLTSVEIRFSPKPRNGQVLDALVALGKVSTRGRIDAHMADQASARQWHVREADWPAYASSFSAGAAMFPTFRAALRTAFR